MANSQKAVTIDAAIQDALNLLGPNHTGAFGFTALGQGRLLVKQKVGDYIVDHTRAVIKVDPTASPDAMATILPARWLSSEETISIRTPPIKITADQAETLALAESDRVLSQIASHQVGQKVVRVEVSPKILLDNSRAWFYEDQTFPLATVAVRIQRANGSTTLYLDPGTGKALGWGVPTP